MENKKAGDLLNWIIESAIKGIPPLSPASKLVEQYKNNSKYSNDDEIVEALIRIECSKNFATGFITGLGGLITIPFSIPSAIGASWVIQARMVAAIAEIYGHDLDDEKIKTLVLLSLAGDSVKEILKGVGVKVANRITISVLIKLPGKIFIEINRKIGLKILQKIGEKSVKNLIKIVPLVGGVVSGGLDSVTTKKIGLAAVNLFKP